MQRVVVADYGMGNLHSIAKALVHVAGGAQIEVSSDPARVDAADRVVFPGVGAMRDCMGGLRDSGLVEPLRRAAREKPFLAICIGMQALMERSEENGGTECLGILPGTVRRFEASLAAADGQRLKIPHMGWNQVHMRAHPLWRGIAPEARFYFVHSYYVDPKAPRAVAATCSYGIEFTAAMARGSLFAVQFHPEKSAATGLRLLANFLAWDGRSEAAPC